MNKGISKKDRMTIYEKCNGHCAYCGKHIKYKEMQVDHIRPKREWIEALEEGQNVNDINNLNPSCRRCNHYKRSLNKEKMKIDRSEEELNYIFKDLIESIDKEIDEEALYRDANNINDPYIRLIDSVFLKKLLKEQNMKIGRSGNIKTKEGKEIGIFNLLAKVSKISKIIDSLKINGYDIKFSTHHSEFFIDTYYICID